MDGEISHESARFLVRRLAADAGLRETWARYHLIRDCLRQQDGEFVTHELRERVQGALAAEPAPEPRARGAGWLRKAVGTAIAASVALVAVLIVVPDQAPVSSPAAAPADQQAALKPFVSPNIGAPVASRPVNLSGTDPDSSEINAYLLRHYQVAGGAGGRGFVSFVPIVVTQGATLQPVADRDDSTDHDFQTR